MIYTILISGKQGSGKSTLSHGLVTRLKKLGFQVEHMKFADPLYQMHNWVRTVLKGYGADNMPEELIDGPLLQLLGTEWGRKTRGENFWRDIATKRVEKHHALRMASIEKQDVKTVFYIFDDARFANEIVAFDTHLCLKVRLEAPEEERKERAEKWRPNTEHPSEISLDDYKDWHVQIDTKESSKEQTLQKILDIVCLDLT